jgi:hypothetical protein
VILLSVAQRKRPVVRIVKRIEGCYETQKVESGRVYRWCPECIVVECDCRKRLILTASVTICDECGTDHAAVVREELTARRLADDKAARWVDNQTAPFFT